MRWIGRTIGLLAFSGAMIATAPAAAEECALVVEPSPDLERPVAISDPMSNAFMPTAATRGARVLLAWQETDRTESRVGWTVIARGCVGAVRYLEESLPRPRRPAVAATASGWVLAYEAQDTPWPLIRSLRLDPDGRPLDEPETISPPGEVASRVRVAAHGEDVVYGWTDVTRHFVARRGPLEELPPTPVGTRLESRGLVNFPRVAVNAEGTIFLAYRDGGPERTDFEVRLLTREVGGEFSEPFNVSRSKGLMSDDVSLALEPDGRLRLVWVEQDAERPDTFEVVHATRRVEGDWSPPERFGTLGLASFKPSVARGLSAAWQAGSVRSGALFLAGPSSPPVRVAPSYMGGMVSLVEDDEGNLHLAFVETNQPARLRYLWRSAAVEDSPALSDAEPAAAPR